MERDSEVIVSVSVDGSRRTVLHAIIGDVAIVEEQDLTGGAWVGIGSIECRRDRVEAAIAERESDERRGIPANLRVHHRHATDHASAGRRNGSHRAWDL